MVVLTGMQAALQTSPPRPNENAASGVNTMNLILYHDSVGRDVQVALPLRSTITSG